MRMAFRTLGVALATVTLSVTVATAAKAAQTELLVYSAIEADQLKAYKEAFEKDNPDIEIRWVRDSTGIVTAKLLAEQAKPTWVGMDVWSSTICYNTVEGERRGIPQPTSWADLTKPEYKGQITLPNPSSSGTGYLMVSAWMQLMGEEKAWEFMDALHENVGAYTHSGSKPCRQAGAGEYAVGISFEYRASRTKADGAPIEIVFPSEGLGWDMEATGILKTTSKPEAAKKLADWAASVPANELYAQGYAVVAIDGVAQPLPHVPADLADRLIDNDFAWAAANRERILAEWSRRYDGKSEPK